MTSRNLFDIKGTKILFSGATGVLGSSMALYLAQQGAELLLLGRTPEKVNALRDQITSEGGKAWGYYADVTDEESLAKVKTLIESQHGSVAVLINAAGGNMAGAVIRPEQSILDLDGDALRQVMDLNYLGTVFPIKVEELSTCFFYRIIGKCYCNRSGTSNRVIKSKVCKTLISRSHAIKHWC